MGSRFAADYQAVLEKLLSLVSLAKVKVCVLDFEPAAWKAVRNVLPQVLIRGCGFHWTQSVYKKIANLGLSGEYQGSGKTSKFLRQLMCLHFLPAEQVRDSFQVFMDIKNTTIYALKLLTYSDHVRKSSVKYSFYGRLCSSHTRQMSADGYLFVNYPFFILPIPVHICDHQ